MLHHCFVNTSRTAMPWEQGFWMPSLSWLGYTGFLSQWRAKLCDWAVRPVRAGCYPWAALTLVNSKTLYNVYSTFYCHGIPNIVSLAQRHLMNHWMYEKGCKKGRAKKAPNDGICFWLWFIISQHSPLLYPPLFLSRLAAEEETRAKSFRIRRWVDTVMDEDAFSISECCFILTLW